MQLKQSAQIRGMRPEMAIALVVIESAFAKQGEHLVITSGTDGTHMPGSCHYKGLAVDIRLPSNPENASVLVQRLKLWLRNLSLMLCWRRIISTLSLILSSNEALMVSE